MIETKKRSLILNIVLSAIILVIGFLLWPSKDKFNQSNPKDSNKTQIKVKVKALNIRKNASTDSEDIGTVYYDEIFTVLSHIDKDDFYWYQIKTKQGVRGYVASDKETPYVEVISGNIDRTPPTIKSTMNPLIFINGIKDYSGVICEDDYSTCTLTYDESNDKSILFKGKDKDDNETTLKIDYFNVYDINTTYNDNSDNLKVKIEKTKQDNNYTFSTTYTTKKVIFNDNKSKKYSPFIEFYDDELHNLEDVFVLYNSENLDSSCINNEDNNLKDVYLKNDILKGSNLCFNYTFTDNEDIKYIKLGFVSIDNKENVENILSNYNSKIFIVK